MTIATDYGDKHIHTLVDASGNSLVWKTSTQRLEPGRRVTCKATIKAHSEFRGQLQTEVTRLKIAA